MDPLAQLVEEARRSPEDATVWIRLARALLEHGHRAAGHEAIERAWNLEKAPEEWLELGYLLEDTGAADDAIDAYRFAIHGLGPDRLRDRVTAYLRLGGLLLEASDIDSALLTLRVAQRLMPEDGEVSARLAEALEEAGLLEEALGQGERTLELGFAAPPVHRLLARLNDRLGRADACIRALRTLTALAPEDVSAALELSTRLSARGEREEARSLLADLSGRMERTPETLLRLGRARAAAKDAVGAVKALRECIRLDPTQAEAHFELGEILLEAGASTEAVVELEAASGLRPGDARVQLRLGHALEAAGRSDAAVRAFVQAAALEPSNRELQGTLARALGRREAVPQDPMGAEASFTGDLEVLGLGPLLEMLALRQATGTLEVGSNRGKGLVRLWEGRITAARVAGGRRLFDCMSARGVAPEGPAEDEVELVRAALGEGYAPEEIERAWRDAAEPSLDTMMGWSQGRARFHAAAPPVPKPGLSFDVGAYLDAWEMGR